MMASALAAPMESESSYECHEGERQGLGMAAVSLPQFWFLRVNQLRANKLKDDNNYHLIIFAISINWITLRT